MLANACRCIPNLQGVPLHREQTVRTIYRMFCLTLFFALFVFPLYSSPFLIFQRLYEWCLFSFSLSDFSRCWSLESSKKDGPLAKRESGARPGLLSNREIYREYRCASICLIATNFASGTSGSFPLHRKWRISSIWWIRFRGIEIGCFLYRFVIIFSQIYIVERTVFFGNIKIVFRSIADQCKMASVWIISFTRFRYIRKVSKKSLDQIHGSVWFEKEKTNGKPSNVNAFRWAKKSKNFHERKREAHADFDRW